MIRTLEQRLELLRVRLDELPFWLAKAHINLDEWLFNGEPLALGSPWLRRDDVVSLEHPQVQAPEAWALEDMRLELRLGGEGLLRIGYPNDAESFGLDPQHCLFPLKDRQFTLQVQAVARLPFGQPNPGARLEAARLLCYDNELARLIRLLQMLQEQAQTLLSRQHEIVHPLLISAENALAMLTWPSATEDYLARLQTSDAMQRIWQLPEGLPQQPAGLSGPEHNSVIRARTQLLQDLKALQGHYPQQGFLSLSGHAHIDLAWLWPLEETRRKAERTFSSTIALMERYPELKFNQSSAQLYAFLEEDNPALFNDIKQRVKTGQWEPIGGMWVEPDTLMPTGESLVRQLLYGQRYFARHFGQYHEVCWLPDCFGFSPALPQILRLAGIESFFTTKMTWNERNNFPFDLFWWEGLDGSRVLAHSFNNPVGSYNGELGPEAMLATWHNFGGKPLHPESLLTVGFGDGGGGVTEEMMQRQRDLYLFPALPRVQFDKVSNYYSRLHKAARRRNFPVWVGEMYLELHRGTLTTQGRTKVLHRQAEQALLSAEVLGSMVALLGGGLPNSLEPLWRLLLRNQFHDILPGSSIREVYVRSEAELAEVISGATTVQQAQLEQLSSRLVKVGEREGLLFVNPSLSPRPVRLELNTPFAGAQAVEEGYVLCSDAQVPGLSVNVLVEASPPEGLSVSSRHLENRYLRLRLADDGSLASIYDKRHNREVLAGRGNQLWAYVDKPRAWDAWDIDASYRNQGEEIRQLSSVEVIEQGPHRAALRLVRYFRNSRIVQELRLWANSPRLEFHTKLDWHDRRWLLKAHFPLQVRSDYATFECAFGVVQRPTHRNTSWDEAQFEVAAHRFADLSEPHYGVALLNNGRYGHHAYGNDLGISLLRSPIFPDTVADEGEHRFSYALLPHGEDWLRGGVLMEAEDLNAPLLAQTVLAQEAACWQPLRLEGFSLGLAALKVREDSKGLVLRCYEPQGARGTAQLHLPKGWDSVAEVNVLEHRSAEASMHFRPFQLHSWWLRRQESEEQ